MIIKTKTGHCIAAGRLHRDAEMRTTSSGIPCTNFSILVNSGTDTEPSEWLRCVCWRDLAEGAQFLTNGDSVIVCGKIQTRSYETRNGEKKTATECVVDGLTRSMALNAAGLTNSAESKEVEPDLIDEDDEELPF